jgi:hypothetical protein
MRMVWKSFFYETHHEKDTQYRKKEPDYNNHHSGFSIDRSALSHNFFRSFPGVFQDCFGYHPDRKSNAKGIKKCPDFLRTYLWTINLLKNIQFSATCSTTISPCYSIKFIENIKNLDLSYGTAIWDYHRPLINMPCSPARLSQSELDDGGQMVWVDQRSLKFICYPIGQIIYKRYFYALAFSWRWFEDCELCCEGT